MKDEIFVAVILIARNEEKIITKTLECIINQKLKPYRIIVINDGSKDKTGEIVSKFSSVELINRPPRDESYLAKKELAGTINLGLEKLQNDQKCQYVCIIGSDILYSENYLYEIVSRMKKNPNLVIASGVGYLRIAADKHWFSDVLVGAGVGYVSGRYIPTLVYQF